jgi:hypothetical protein
VTIRLVVLLFAGILLLGCGNREMQNESAVRQGVLDYLSRRSDLNLNSMQVDVTSVSFRQDEADAVVSFRPKGSGGSGMQMRYTLERKGNQWVVKGKGRAQTGQAPHGMGQMPGGAGQMPGAMPQGSELPPGHPPVGNPPPTK